MNLTQSSDRTRVSINQYQSFGFKDKSFLFILQSFSHYVLSYCLSHFSFLVSLIILIFLASSYKNKPKKLSSVLCLLIFAHQCCVFESFVILVSFSSFVDRFFFLILERKKKKKKKRKGQKIKKGKRQKKVAKRRKKQQHQEKERKKESG